MHRLETNNATPVEVEFEGLAIPAREGDSVAAALLSADQLIFRETPISGAARGAFCMMGVCFDCLVEIDGVANVQACMTEVRAGMRIRRQRGAHDIHAQDPEPVGKT